MSSNTSDLKVIVFGSTGAVGTTLIDILCQQQPQWQVLAVTRRKTDSLQFPPQVTVVEGDVEDLPRVLELTKDVDIIYSCVGFPQYERKYWAKHWPIVVENLLQAVVASNNDDKKKKLVFCDNLYAYGFNHDNEHKMNTSTATLPPSLKSKPAIRSTMRQTFIKHMQEHPNTLAVVGGADFFGKGVTKKSFLGDTFTRKLVKGETPLCMGSPTTVHDFCYVPDFADALYIASIDERALDKFWIAPHSVHGKTLQNLANDMKAAMDNRPLSDSAAKDVKIQVFSKGMIGFLGFFMSFMAEMKEMMDSWTKPYCIDDSEFCNTFNVEATPYEQALTEYVEFFKNVVAEEGKAK